MIANKLICACCAAVCCFAALSLGLTVPAADAVAQVATAAAPANDQRQPAQFVVRVGGGRSDNILRAPSAEQSGSYRMFGVAFDLARNDPRMNALLDGDLEKRSYSLSGIADEVYGTLDGSVELQAVPKRFSWLIGDNYGQARTDPFQIDSPINRQHVNVASTGPRLNLPVGARTVLQVSGTVAKRSFQDTSFFDGKTRTAEIGFDRAISSRAKFGFTASGRRADYDALPARNNRVDNFYLSYRSLLASGRAMLALGTSRAERGADTRSKPYVSLEWENDVGARSHLTVNASNQFIDAGSAFALATATNFDVQRLQDILPSADLYQSSVAGLTYTMTFPRTSVLVSTSALRERFEADTSLDNNRRQVNVELRHELSVGLEAGILAYASRQKFDTIGRQDDQDRSQQLWIRKRFAGRLSIEFRYQHDARHGAPLDSFDENTVRVVFLCNLNQRAVRAGLVPPATGGAF